MSDQTAAGSYALLESVLSAKGMQLKGTYTMRDVAEIFGVSIRAIQERVRTGVLKARDR